jgi:predicted nucleic acid-binding protein
MVVDTNVIVSALVFGGVPRRVLELAQTVAT